LGVVLPRPERRSVLSWKAAPPLFRLATCVADVVEVFVSAVVVSAKNWTTDAPYETGVPPPHAPCVFGPPVNQSSVAAGVPVTLLFCQV
jgi:hypothetical protein